MGLWPVLEVVVANEGLLMDVAKLNEISVDVAAVDDSLDEVRAAGAGASEVQGPCAVVPVLVADQVYVAYLRELMAQVMVASLVADQRSSSDHHRHPLVNSPLDLSSYLSEVVAVRVVPDNSYYIPSL